MIVEVPEIIKLIKADKPAFIFEAQKAQVKLNVHINGRNLDNYLKLIDGYESEEKFALRKKTAISNKHVFANILRPVDKVFTAKGGSKIYNISGTENNEKKLKEKLGNVSKGMSLKKWIQKVQANKYYSDPSGIILFEVSKEGGETFPTIKSISKIKNYLLNGRRVEWVLFEGEERYNENGERIPGEFFRFMDDANDYMFHKDGDTVKQIDEETFEILWDKLPAITNSDIINDEMRYMDSPVHEIVELADKYLRTNTIKNIFEFLHGFPFFWMYYKKCESCKGTGEKGGDDCSSCNGTGVSLKKDVTDVLLLNTPRKEGQPVIAPNVAGYVVPPIEIPKEQRDELNWLWKIMHFTVWGSSHESSEGGETATGRFLDIEPVNDRLGGFSDAFQETEQIMTDLIGQFYFQEVYKGASISYGRRFLMEPPDKIWEKYLAAKQKGAPKATLTHILRQYFQSEFMNDPQMLAIMEKSIKVEPFVHSGVEQIRGLVDPKVFTRKVYFGEWWNIQEDQYLLTAMPDKMIEDLDKYIEQFEAPESDPETPVE